MIRVLLFGSIAARAGCREVLVDLAGAEMTVRDVLDEVRRRFTTVPEAPYLLALNQEQAEIEATVKDGDEVAIMPPFSGG